MSDKFPVVFHPENSAGGLPLQELQSSDQLIDPTTGLPYISGPGDGRLTFGPTPPADPLHTYAEGDTRINTDPATNKSVGGWICTTAGIGGVAVFTPFYLVYGTPVDKQAVIWNAVAGHAKWAEVPSGGGGGDDDDDDVEGGALDDHLLTILADAFTADAAVLKAAYKRSAGIESSAASAVQAQLEQALPLLLADAFTADAAVLKAANKRAGIVESDAALAVQAQLEQAVSSALADAYTADAAVEKAAYKRSRIVESNAALAVQAQLTQAAADAESTALLAVASAEALLNNRVGKKFALNTLDAVPTVIANITPPSPRASRLFCKVVAQRADHLEAAIYNVLALARAVPASNVLTIVALVPGIGETVTIGPTLYTWQNVPAAAYDVLIGGSVSASLDNLIKAINLTGIAGVDYGVGTTKNLVASAVKASANTLEAVALIPSVGGNFIAVAAIMADGAWSFNPFMTGGLSMALFGVVVTAEYEDDAAWDVGIAVAGGIYIELSVTGAVDTPIKWLAEVTAVEIF
jgi:hypothetical protein